MLASMARPMPAHRPGMVPMSASQNIGNATSRCERSPIRVTLRTPNRSASIAETGVKTITTSEQKIPAVETCVSLKCR